MDNSEQRMEKPVAIIRKRKSVEQAEASEGMENPNEGQQELEAFASETEDESRAEEARDFESQGDESQSEGASDSGARSPVRIRVKRKAPRADSSLPGEGQAARSSDGPMAKPTEPTEGRVELRGRVGSLLEVGTGFHLELTGRENIYLSGAILGMKRAEIVQRFDEIVAFAEVERFLDTPVKHYSTGMYLRLAFAVAAHLEPEILLVDEVLAVGDAEFQKKCLGKMKDVANSGRTVVFVSHDLAAIRQLVDRALLLDGGLLTMAGPPGEVIRSYLSASGGSPSDLRSRTDRKGSQIVRALELQIRAQGRETMGGATADDVVFELIYHSAAPSPLRGIKATLGIYDALGRAVHDNVRLFYHIDVRSRDLNTCSLELRLRLRGVAFAGHHGGRLRGVESGR